MYGREELDVNKLIYSKDIETCLVDCEGTEVWPQDSNGNEYLYKSQADKVMDAMERRIARLTALVEGYKQNSLELGRMYNGRIKELEKENRKLKSKIKDDKWLCQGSVDAPSSVDSNQSWGVFG